MGSFVDYFIANELSKNPDAYRLSTFIHKKKDPMVVNFTWGQCGILTLDLETSIIAPGRIPEGFVILFNFICPDDYWLIPFWWNRLFEDPAFQAATAARWTAAAQWPLSNQ